MELDKESRGAQAARALADAVNGFTAQDYQQFAMQLCEQEHRTLQQNAFRAFVATLKHWSDDYVHGRYDGRNEVTCGIANAIVRGNPLRPGALERVPMI